MFFIHSSYQINEVGGHSTVWVSDCNALWSPYVFGSISQTKSVHPWTCVRQETNMMLKIHPACNMPHTQSYTLKQENVHTHTYHLPLGITMLMEEGQAASMKSSSRGLSRCRTGSSCLIEEIHRDMGRSCACFFTLRSNTAI